MFHLEIPFPTLLEIIKQIKLITLQQGPSQHSLERLQGEDHDPKLDHKLHDELCKGASSW